MDSATKKRLVAASFIVMSSEYLKLKRKEMKPQKNERISSAYLKMKKKENKPKKRRWWMVPLHRNRNSSNAADMLEDLRREPSGKFENFCKMSAPDFEYLLNKIGPMVAKLDTNMRQAIPVQERLAVTLSFLASGDSFKSLSLLFKFSTQTVSRCVNDVCLALIEVLRDEIKIPTIAQEWLDIAKEFENKFNFPHCVGLIDGKHIVVQTPTHSELELDNNYKGSFTVVLTALVDANYCFTFAEIGSQGHITDDDVFQKASLFRKLNENKLMLPPEEPLPFKKLPMPYVIVGDDSFPSMLNIMKPYPGLHDGGSAERAFNYRLARIRRIGEHVFGIMSSVFRTLRKPMMLQPDRVANIAMTCVLLHNFLRRSETSSSKYSPEDAFDSEHNGEIISGTWRQDNRLTSLLPVRRIPKEAGPEAKTIREAFAEYFATNGREVH